MSKPRYKWWGYVKWVIRDYPQKKLPLSGQSLREYEAVKQAAESSEELMVKFIDLVFWKRTHTIAGAALVCHVSQRTAERWHGEFIRDVAKNMSLLD